MSMKSLIAAMPWRRRASICWRSAASRAIERCTIRRTSGSVTLLSRSVSYWLNSECTSASASARSTKPSRLVSRFWNSDRARLRALLEGRPVGHVGREGRLGDLDELLERELAVLVGVEFLERLHAVLQEVGARDLALLVGVDLDEPLRQRNRRRRADGLLGRRRAWSRGARARWRLRLAAGGVCVAAAAWRLGRAGPAADWPASLVSAESARLAAGRRQRQ